MFLTVYIVS